MRNTKMNKTKNASKRFDDLLPCEVKKIIYNGPAVIVEFKDGSKQVSKCMKSDIYDPEKGLMLCLLKNAYGEDIYHNFIQPIALSSGKSTIEEAVEDLVYLRAKKASKYIKLQQEHEFKERLDMFEDYIAYRLGGLLGEAIYIAFGDDTDDETES